MFSKLTQGELKLIAKHKGYTFTKTSTDTAYVPVSAMKEQIKSKFGCEIQVLDVTPAAAEGEAAAAEDGGA